MWMQKHANQYPYEEAQYFNHTKTVRVQCATWYQPHDIMLKLLINAEQNTSQSNRLTVTMTVQEYIRKSQVLH